MLELGDRVRTRRTKAEVSQLESQILEILEEDHPQSVRHVFYRTTDPRLPVSIDKSETGYKQVQQRLVEMRRRSRLPYGWISDSSRTGYFTAEYDGLGQYVAVAAALYRRAIWDATMPLVEVWCESRSIAGVIRDVCMTNAVSLFPMGGFSSVTFVFEASVSANEVGRPLTVLYVGDLDPSGVWIDKSLEREMSLHLTVPLDFRRLAITPQQVSEYSLPEKPRKASERRSPDLKVAVEAEAMPAHVLRTLVRDAIEFYLPAGQLERVKVAEASEREQLKSLARRLYEKEEAQGL